MVRRRNNSQQTILGSILILVVFAILVFLFIYYTQNTIKKDGNGCPKDNQLISERWIVLVDTTSVFKENEKLALENLAESLTSVAPMFTEISIYSLGDEIISKSNLLANACNPGDPNEINEWVDSARKIRNQFNYKFKAKIENSIKSASQSKGADQSPIIKSLQTLSLLELDTKKPKRLYIISDFLENSDIFNFYNEIPNYDHLSQSGFLNDKYASLFNTQIFLMILPNDYKIQTDRFYKFWRSYLMDSGASITQLNGKGYCFFGSNCNFN